MGATLGSVLVSKFGLRNIYLAFGITHGASAIVYFVVYRLWLRKLEEKRLAAKKSRRPSLFNFDFQFRLQVVLFARSGGSDWGGKSGRRRRRRGDRHQRRKAAAKKSRNTNTESEGNRFDTVVTGWAIPFKKRSNSMPIFCCRSVNLSFSSAFPLNTKKVVENRGKLQSALKRRSIVSHAE